MKTNQIIVRDTAFVQRTKDCYFNANTLLEFWNSSNNKTLQLNNYKKNSSTFKFIKQLQSEGIEQPIISGRGKHGGTWMHPKLFVDFAMWVSVEFKSKVIDYVLDGLIYSRHNAGDYYKDMCATILDEYIKHYNKKPNPFIYITEANIIKEAAKIDKSRNELSEKELNLITTLQKHNSNMIKKNIGKASRVKQLNLLAESLSL